MDDPTAELAPLAEPKRSTSTNAGVSADAARPPASVDESALVVRLKRGEDAAFEELVRTMTGRLLAVVRRYSRNEQDAEDAVQEAFLSAFKAIGSFDGRSSLSTWLHRIAINAALMKARRDKTRREASIEDLLPRFHDGMHADHPRSFKGVTNDGGIGIETRAAVLEALERLPDDYRTVLVLRDIEGLESKAVANALGISDASVRQRLHRARQALMKLLEPKLAENDE